LKVNVEFCVNVISASNSSFEGKICLSLTPSNIFFYRVSTLTKQQSASPESN